MKIFISDAEIRVVVAKYLTEYYDSPLLNIKSEDLRTETIYDSLKESDVFSGYVVDS